MWIPVALGRDLPRESTRAVILDAQEFVAWRGAGGTVEIWEDRCPHRGMRLSFGFVRGDGLNCLYHGWTYGPGGSCRRIPAHPDLTVPPTIRARAFAAAEAGGMIWASLAADPGRPPSLPAARPVASLAVASTVETLYQLLGDPLSSADSQYVETTLDGIPVTLGWHVTTPGRMMLHAVTTAPDAVERRVFATLQRLRTAAEERAAA